MFKLFLNVLFYFIPSNSLWRDCTPTPTCEMPSVTSRALFTTEQICWSSLGVKYLHQGPTRASVIHRHRRAQHNAAVRLPRQRLSFLQGRKWAGVCRAKRRLRIQQDGCEADSAGGRCAVPGSLMSINFKKKEDDGSWRIPLLLSLSLSVTHSHTHTQFV